MLRCEPTRATGFAPAELMIGRPMVYPREFEKMEIDFEGVKIKKAQEKYKKNYDKRVNAKPFKIKAGDKVQYKRYKSKRILSKEKITQWCPVKSYLLVFAVDHKKQRVMLQDQFGKILKRTHPFERIRKFKNLFYLFNDCSL